MSLQLGCPVKCSGYTCVDLNPEEEGVIASEAIRYLKCLLSNSQDAIYSKNMLEHITEIHEFFLEASRVLKKGGALRIITDNAAFLPYHLPIIHRLGFGAHSSNKYFENYKYQKCGVHFMLFTKNDLRNIFEKYGLEVSSNRLRDFGARVEIIGRKL